MRRVAALALTLLAIQGCAGPGRPRPSPAAPAPAAGTTPVATEPSRLAGVEVRLARLEEDLRRITGRLDELAFEQRAASGRVDQLVADIDRRLRTLEGGDAAPGLAAPGLAVPDAGGFAAPPPEAPPPLAAPAPPFSSETGAARQRPGEVGTPGAPAPDAAAQRGYVLGTLPREAIMGEGAGAPSRPAPGAESEPQRRAALPPAPAPQGPRARYDAALGLLQSGDFAAARRAFGDFLADYPDDPLAPSAAYWLAETHYVSKDFDSAAALFARNYQTYGPDAAKAPDNLLKMGMALTQLGQRDQACQTFAELERRYPDAAAPIRQAAERGKAGAGCR